MNNLESNSQSSANANSNAEPESAHEGVETPPPESEYSDVSGDLRQPRVSKVMWAGLSFLFLVGAALAGHAYLNTEPVRKTQDRPQEALQDEGEGSEIVEALTPDVDIAQEPDSLPPFEQMIAPNNPKITSNIIDDQIGGYTDEGLEFVEAFEDSPKVQLVDALGEHVGAVSRFDPDGAIDQPVIFTLRPELLEKYDHSKPFQIPLNRLLIAGNTEDGYVFQLTEEQTRFLATLLELRDTDQGQSDQPAEDDTPQDG